MAAIAAEPLSYDSERTALSNGNALATAAAGDGDATDAALSASNVAGWLIWRTKESNLQRATKSARQSRAESNRRPSIY